MDMINQRENETRVRSPLADVRRTVLVLAVSAPWLLLVALRLFENLLIGPLGGSAPPFVQVLITDVSIALVGILATPFALWLALRYPVSALTWRRHVPLLALGAVALALLMNLVRTQLWLWAGIMPASGFLHAALLTLPNVFHIDVINIAFIMSAAHLLLYLRDRQEKSVRAAKLEAQLSEARMHTLQAQLQPHFLFNALHTVGQLVRTQRNAEAMQVVERLGDLLRRSLDDRRSTFVSLADEIGFAQAYLEIESIRFADRLRVEWHCEPGVERAQVPALVLQPIIENAVRHGIALSSSAGRLSITIGRIDGTLRIFVRDDGRGVAAGWQEGIGIRNTRERLANAFAGAARFELRNTGEGSEAVLEMPFRTSAS